MTTTTFGQLYATASEGPEPVPGGNYDLRVKTASYASFKDGAKHGIKLVLEIISGPSAGKTIWDQIIMSLESEGAMGFFFQNLAAVGVDRAYLDGFGAWDVNDRNQAETVFSQIAATVTGAVFTAEVGIKTWQGKKRNEIKGAYKAAAAGTGLPVAQAVPAGAVPAAVPPTTPVPTTPNNPTVPATPVSPTAAPAVPAAPEASEASEVEAPVAAPSAPSAPF